MIVCLLEYVAVTANMYRLRLLCRNSIEMCYCRLDSAPKNIQMTTESENDRKTSRHRARVISSSSDEDENESNDQQVNTWNAVLDY